MTMLKNILAPTDFSQNSSRAIQYACDLARDSDSTLHLLHVSKDDLDSTAREKRLERVGNAVDAPTELELETVKRVVVGNPSEAISEYAQDNTIDLIVMGTHGRTGLTHLALGSVAESVLREAPCPVTVLGPHDGQNASLAHAVAELEQMIGGAWQMDKAMGRTLMSKRLVDALRVPTTTAIMMVDELEHREWLKWEDGNWLIVEGNELIDDLGPIFAEEHHESQAIDLIKRAKKLRVTDIHIDPKNDDEHLIRFRIDGQLAEYSRIDRSVAEHLFNQYKMLAQLDNADPFLPIEGRIRLPANMAGIEVRFSLVPVAEGHAVALRILNADNIFLPLSSLGFSESAYSEVEQILKTGEGLVLVTGPTGSGKTTTVYSMLETVGGSERNIVSIEDPVEFSTPFVRQINVDQKHGLTMASGLRSLLRMDPDALFVGEIRDPDAAEIALRAASSGKYVFSTMHTRNVASTISALLELGLSKSSIATNLSGIVNQRLVRKLCSNCKKPIEVTDRHRRRFSQHGVEVSGSLFAAAGCKLCSHRGFHGRTAVFEVCSVDKEISDAVFHFQSTTEFSARLKKRQTPTLQQDAFRKVAVGEISFEEAESMHWLS